MILRMIAMLFITALGWLPPVATQDGSRTGTLLQATVESPMTAPLYMGEAPPECRTLRSIRIPLGDGDRPGGKTQEEALALARNLRGMLQAGASFEGLARSHSGSAQARNGGVLGTFPAGVLLPAFDAFLFRAKVGEVSEPVAGDDAVYLLQRVERWAACRQIFLKGRGAEVREKAEELVERLRAGEDYVALAREHSADPASAKRGGAWRIFERGADDTLLKKAAFEAQVGEVFGPLASPLGFHVGKREPSTIDSDPGSGFRGLREDNWVRATGLLIAHEKSKTLRTERSVIAASDLIQELFALAQARSLPLSALAEKHSDEPGGRARKGDLGWIYRGNPNRLPPLEKLFLVRPGTLLEPKHTDEGWVLLQRTR